GRPETNCRREVIVEACRRKEIVRLPTKSRVHIRALGLAAVLFSKSHKPALLILTFQANSGIIRTQLNHQEVLCHITYIKSHTRAKAGRLCSRSLRTGSKLCDRPSRN